MLCTDQMVHAGRSPLRRLTRFEYNNTVRDLFGDATQPANALPAEELGNGFGNDADTLSVSGLLAEQYLSVAEGIATRATTAPALAQLDPCTSSVTTATEDACAATIIQKLAPLVYRRPLVAGESDALLALAKSTRATANATFATGISSLIQAMLQSPDFLYRLEFGVADSVNAALKRPSGDEMATRLSYLFFGTLPDATLRSAAKTGELVTKQGVLAQATRMLDDPRSHAVVRFFFDNLLPINGLTDLTRDKVLFPSFSPTIGAAMHEETQQFLEYEIFSGPGTWPSALTAPYTAAGYDPAPRPSHAGWLDDRDRHHESEQPRPARVLHRQQVDVPPDRAADGSRHSRPGQDTGRHVGQDGAGAIFQAQFAADLQLVPSIHGPDGVRARELQSGRSLPHARERSDHRCERQRTGHDRDDQRSSGTGAQARRNG
jgi:hypothetical protein